MVEGRGRDFDQTLACRLRMGRKNQPQQLPLARNDLPLIVERIIPPFADQFRNVLLFLKVLVEPPDLRQHLQVGEILRQKILVRFLRHASRAAKLLEQLAIARISPDHINGMSLKQILQRKPAFLLRQFLCRPARHQQERVLRLSRNVILNLQDQRWHEVECLMHLGKFIQQLHHPVVVLQGMQPRPGQPVLPGHQVFIERLMLMPQDDNSHLRHDLGFPLNLSAKF